MELDACGDFAGGGALAAEHEEVGCIMETGGIVVWIALVEDGEVGGVDGVAAVLRRCGVGGKWEGWIVGDAGAGCCCVGEGVRKCEATFEEEGGE